MRSKERLVGRSAADAAVEVATVTSACPLMNNAPFLRSLPQLVSGSLFPSPPQRGIARLCVKAQCRSVHRRDISHPLTTHWRPS